MDMNITALRIGFLKDMHNYIIDMGDEVIYEIWIEQGIPDEPDEEIFEFIASNDDEWHEVCALFGELVKED